MAIWNLAAVEGSAIMVGARFCHCGSVTGRSSRFVMSLFRVKARLGLEDVLQLKVQVPNINYSILFIA